MFKNKAEYIAFRNQLIAEAETALANGDQATFEAKKAAIEAADAQFEAMAQNQANLNSLKTPSAMNFGNVAPVENELPSIPKGDPRATDEYRNAFMNFMKTGVMDKVLQNANATTLASDAGALVPVTIMNEIIKKMRAYGQIFNRVRKLNVKGGVEFPILSLKPVATWIGDGVVSDRQKVTANTKVSFAYHGIECRVAVSLLADTITLDGFESLITDLIVEAIIVAVENSIINGTGSGQPLGITKDARIPAGNIITLTAAKINTYKGWADDVFAVIPLAYRAGASWMMASGTFESKIKGMVDTAGQPVGGVNRGIADGVQERFDGREVILVEDDVIKPYATAATGDIIAVYCKLTDYVINSNMQMTSYRFFDQDKNEWVDKMILICDGKILDPNGVIIVKKGA